MSKPAFYTGAFLGAAVMTLIHFAAPDSIHWWTPLMWLGIWTAIEGITHLGTRALADKETP